MSGQRILKYTIPFMPGPHIVQMPCGSHPMNAQMQGDQLAIWCMVPLTAPVAENVFRVVMTGDSVEGGDGFYFATVQHEGFVGHIFDEGATDPAPGSGRAGE